MLKIISGELRGRVIKFPLKKTTTRPTSSVVKEALFNILQFEIKGASFVDLYFGSGQIGLEALSRGAERVIFVDKDYECKWHLIKNIDNMGLKSGFEIINMEVDLFLSHYNLEFDIAFLDPPYDSDLIDHNLSILVTKMKKNSSIIAETEKNYILKDNYGEFIKVKSYHYGKKKLTLYKN